MSGSNSGGAVDGPAVDVAPSGQEYTVRNSEDGYWVGGVMAMRSGCAAGWDDEGMGVSGTQVLVGVWLVVVGGDGRGGMRWLLRRRHRRRQQVRRHSDAGVIHRLAPLQYVADIVRMYHGVEER